MNKNKIIILSIITISLFFPSNFSLAGETIPERLKQYLETIQEKFQNKAEEKKEEVKEEIKQEIKSEAKEQVQKKSKWAGEKIRSWLAPLKIKIQQGSGALRGWMEKGIDWIKSLSN